MQPKFKKGAWTASEIEAFDSIIGGFLPEKGDADEGSRAEDDPDPTIDWSAVSQLVVSHIPQHLSPVG